MKTPRDVLLALFLAVSILTMTACTTNDIAAIKPTPRLKQSPDLGNAHYRKSESLTAVVALADKVPMLRVNLNNYKYHGNPILRGGAPGEWDEAGIERVVIQRVGQRDWRMWYGGRCKDESLKIGYATSAGAIPPKDAFAYTFNNGADFALAGMFDFDIAEDCQITRDTVAQTKGRTSRPWCA